MKLLTQHILLELNLKEDKNLLEVSVKFVKVIADLKNAGETANWEN